jgi:hypothetical protein
MLSDQVQYYGDNEPIEELRYNYKRKKLELVEIEIIAKCHLCGCLIADGQEVLTYNDETFCSSYHIEEYKEFERDGEVA